MVLLGSELILLDRILWWLEIVHSSGFSRLDGDSQRRFIKTELFSVREESRTLLIIFRCLSCPQSLFVLLRHEVGSFNSSQSIMLSFGHSSFLIELEGIDETVIRR